MFLIWGHNGWIGQQLCEILETRGLRYKGATSRADHVASVGAEMDELQPTHVICAIGRTHNETNPTIDALEAPGMLPLNLRDNLGAPLVLAAACRSRGIHMTYLGTGCIFHGGRVYDETDDPDFTGSSYSAVKGWTDRLMKHIFNDTVLNARIRMPISWRAGPREFITKIAGYQRICSAENSMTVLDDLLPVLVDVACQHITGTLNLVNPGTMTHVDILDAYRRYIDPEHVYELMTYEEQSSMLASKRSNNQLSTKRLESLASVPTLHDSVDAALRRRRDDF